MGKHYSHIDLEIIVQLTYNIHTIYGGSLVVHDAKMQYPPLYDIWVGYSYLGIFKYMCYIALVM